MDEKALALLKENNAGMYGVFVATVKIKWEE